MKLEDNSINTFQAAVAGARCLALAMIPHCQPWVSCVIPSLQAPAGARRRQASS